MKIDKVSEYKLKDDVGNEVRIKNIHNRWLIVKNDEIVFSFDIDDARKFANLFDEINRSSSVTDLKVWKDIDNAFAKHVEERKLKHDGEHLHY